MRPFYCNIVLYDDVNGEDISNCIRVENYMESDYCLSALIAHSTAELARREITEQSNPSTNQIIVKCYCQAVSDGPLFSAGRSDADQPASYREYYEHLSVTPV